MTVQFVKATKQQARARVTIDGASGSGKTYSALILATVLAAQEKSRIAVIDTERGSASLYSDLFDFDVLNLGTDPQDQEPFRPSNYTAAIKAAEGAGYKVIVIDSLSHAWEGSGGALELVDKASMRNKGNSYVSWRDVTPEHRGMVDAILQSSAHVITTMRSKMDYVQEKDAQGKTVIRKIGMAPIQRQGMEYEFTLVGDMDTDHHISITKSRCTAMTDRVAVKPGPEFWKPFITWLNDGAPTPTPAPAATTKPEPPAQQTDGTFVTPPAATAMTIEQAEAEQSQDGTPYGTIASEDLTYRLNNLLKAKTPTNVQTRKINALKLILDYRAKGRPVVVPEEGINYEDMPNDPADGLPFGDK